MATETTTKTTTPAETTTPPNLADYEKQIVGQIEAAEARIETFETKAKDNRLTAEIKAIDQLKVAREKLQNKLQSLSTTSQANIVRAKADIDKAAVALKASLDEFGRKLAELSAKK
jgi:uncharacterized coiled-coil DUF342 family protein